MPPKGGNAKKEGGRAKKAENEVCRPHEILSLESLTRKGRRRKLKPRPKGEQRGKLKNGRMEVSRGVQDHADELAKGSSKTEAAAARAAEAARNKAEREALLAAEESSLPSKPKSVLKAGAKKKPPSDIPKATGAGLAGFGLDDPMGLRTAKGEDGEVVEGGELSATGVQGMLEAMEIVNQRTDRETLGAKAGLLVEKHPERRFKAAFEAYLEREMPKLREEHPGLRQNQMRDLLFKQFQKAPENPFNQAQVAYNATKDDRVDALRQVMDAREAKYRVES